MGTFQKYSACAQWVLGGQIASELTMNSPCTHWVNTPLPPVAIVSLRSSTPYYIVRRRRAHFHLCPQYQTHLVLLCWFLFSSLASSPVFSALPPQWIDLCRAFILTLSTLLSSRYLRSWVASIHRSPLTRTLHDLPRPLKPRLLEEYCVHLALPP